MKRDKVRDPVSGRYAFNGNYDRRCKCGHALGGHVHGGFDCLVGESSDCPGERCPCTKFRSALTPKGESNA